MLPDWIGQVGGLLAAVVALGGITQYLRGSRDKGTIATLESSNESLLQWQTVAKGDIEGLKADAAATKMLHDAEVAALKLRIDALEDENTDLRKQRPSAEAIQSLREQLALHDAVTLAAIAELHDEKRTT